MRLNEQTKLLGQRVVLVPYEARHVPKYHEWMSSATLRSQTASDELTLSEEYAMQQSWRQDNDKLTFIVLCAETYAQTNDEIAAMVGDTNLFLRPDEETPTHYVAEAEIMIATSEARGKGFGREAMLLMFKYAHQHLPLTKFEAKIDMDNVASLRLFKSFQFVETRRVEIFHEVTLERIITAEWLAWLSDQVQLTAKIYEHA
ncbi:N-acetyltransferase 9-like protein [Drosophila grimshawi]|uniref:GH18940 n=1 Tax=Drosophila grimshawi TaxID=7222 RepID=B4JH80_DROGR|nr:N-acetyltransferase 9-like protein [Drosophila grimshawi]EDV92771.1 GH18940 [Drosophila grimshawi]